VYVHCEGSSNNAEVFILMISDTFSLMSHCRNVPNLVPIHLKKFSKKLHNFYPLIYVSLLRWYRTKVVVEWLVLCFVFGTSRVQISARDRISWLSFASVPPDICRDSTLKLGHHHFLPHPFQFIILLSMSHSTPYSRTYWESVVK
jgi:hypothetical protein